MKKHGRKKPTKRGRPVIGTERRIDRSVSLSRLVWAFHRRDKLTSPARSIEALTLRSDEFAVWINAGEEE